MSNADDQLELTKTRAHIQRILDTGQSVTADGRALTMVALPELRAHVGWLENRIAANKAQAGTRKKGRNRLIGVVPRA